MLHQLIHGLLELTCRLRGHHYRPGPTIHGPAGTLDRVTHCPRCGRWWFLIATDDAPVRSTIGRVRFP